MTKIIPLEDNIVVKAIEQETKTVAGIILPDSGKEKPSVGEVIAVGEGKILDNGERAPIDVKVGDTVYFTKYSPEELDVDGEKFLIIRQSSILVKKA